MSIDLKNMTKVKSKTLTMHHFLMHKKQSQTFHIVLWKKDFFPYSTWSV